jgi:hypothetical protein
MEFTKDGDVKVLTGNLVIGTSGQGIDFSATAGTGTSELLDDYEEGTFTPEIADASSGGNVAAIGTAEGYYTKIGRLVNVSLRMNNINTSGMTSGNDIFFRGLPFTQASDSNYVGTVLADRLNFTNYTVAVGYPGESYIKVHDIVDSAADAVLTVAAITSTTSDIFITFSYHV